MLWLKPSMTIDTVEWLNEKTERVAARAALGTQGFAMSADPILEVLGSE